jgi:glycosyltransferase involved in cell wall biosynthesis
MFQNKDHPPRNSIKGKPRILIVGPTFKQPGGIGMINEIILGSDLNKNFELIHLDTTRPKAVVDKVATLATVNFYLFFQQSLRLVKILIFKRPQIMHQPITDRISFWKEAAFMLIARLFRVKIVGHLNGCLFPQLFENANRVVKHMIKAVMHLPSVIIATSNCWQSYLQESISPCLDVVIIPNPITPDIAELSNHPKTATPETKPVILFVGSLGLRKGFFDALKAVPIVHSRILEAQFVFAGDVAIENEQKMVDRARFEAIANKGVAFPGIVTGKEKLALFQEASLLILPSYFENLPLVVLEAMAAGLPLVVTPVGALPELIEEGINGFFVQPGDYEALAERIIYLLKNHEERKAIGMNNAAKFLQGFSPKFVIAKIEQTYFNVLGLTTSKITERLSENRSV